MVKLALGAVAGFGAALTLVGYAVGKVLDNLREHGDVIVVDPLLQDDPLTRISRR